jgi:poly-gamma-glutamate synthesis protein (capsule biosynthesis protein)
LITLIEEYKLVNRKIVFYIHAGLETVDVPLPFFRELYQHLVDAGVDLVIGHHPHVIQGMEIYKTGLIYYSIGDFIFNSKNVKRFESVGCGLGLNIVMGELVLTHHYFCQSDDGLLELIDRDLIMDATRKLYNNDYASNMFLTAYKKQILPLRNFAEGRLSRFLPIRTNLSILFRSLFIPVLTKKRRTQFEIHLLENESYRELENLFGRK